MRWNCQLGDYVQVVTSRYLEQLSTGMVLKLSATRPSSGQSSAVERISKVGMGPCSVSALLAYHPMCMV